MLAARGITVARASLEARIADEDGGVLIAGGDSVASVSWALDGGAIHLYDFAGSNAELTQLLASAETIARARFAAVLCASVRDAALERALLDAGFELDFTEADDSDGLPTRLQTLVRAV